MRKNGTIFLLIEDDPNDVLFAQQEFKNHVGYCRLEVVSDGIEAVRYLEGRNEYADRDKHPLPDTIILDLKMPRFSGFDFLDWLRTKAPNAVHLIPVVVLSSSNLAEDVVKAYALGASSYHVKPGSWGEYRNRLRAMISYWAEHAETPKLPVLAPRLDDAGRPIPRPPLITVARAESDRL
jgi:CheY-like chemotaxis protein